VRRDLDADGIGDETTKPERMNDGAHGPALARAMPR
jgi:hypothetical protein